MTLYFPVLHSRSFPSPNHFSAKMEAARSSERWHLTILLHCLTIRKTTTWSCTEHTTWKI